MSDLCYKCRIRPLEKFYTRVLTDTKVVFCSREGLCKACGTEYRGVGFTLKEVKA